MGRVLRLAGLTALVGIGLVLLGWVFYSRAAFGTWNPLAPPNRIGYCDRTYYPGPHVTRAQLDTVGNDLGIFAFRQVALTAGGAPVFAKPMPDGMRHATPYSGPLPCAMTIYLELRPGDYIAYGMSGGP